MAMKLNSWISLQLIFVFVAALLVLLSHGGPKSSVEATEAERPVSALSSSLYEISLRHFLNRFRVVQKKRMVGETRYLRPPPSPKLHSEFRQGSKRHWSPLHTWPVPLQPPPSSASPPPPASTQPPLSPPSALPPPPVSA
ncbi:hypothetical protein ERO13_D08G234250v2 [Gossypium hirsutum]|uniref:Uncharacterized protein n=3 Tax=Gossypium TaxID=3633 RepID=A0A5J5QKR2_GOSBA|nr:hypothetical protein ES319_D08G257200v1 [Gossypium barbadense]KAG4135725.1 hypothetical protein ERO13_D08G234250v2 [Gossypium hirsutum]PPD77111.1 hypothetical protein GOBAR_DD25973 [Gossypium barbadense]TYG59029.1 hypothetical protein ES288_D08G269300v1 [Gossypium darwinii]TYI70959.1 hypothetical protein E1A91_D08G260300v1 [Gossypium mustelinum]